MVTERTYIVPLRKEWLKVPQYKRAKKAVSALKSFLAKHMKSDDVRLGRNLNMKLWEKGITNPPHKVKVLVIKEDDGVVKAELFGHKYKEKKIKTKKKEKSKKEELLEKLAGKPKAEPKKEEAKEDKKEELKKEEAAKGAEPKAEEKPKPKRARKSPTQKLAEKLEKEEEKK